MSFFDETDDEPDVSPRSGRALRRGLAGLGVTGLVAGALVFISPSSALADPSANDWYRLRMCESSNNYSINTGNGYYGAYQFDLPTWRSVGGTGLPSSASKATQDRLALRLYHERGWQPWTCARILGLGSGDSTHGVSSNQVTSNKPRVPAWPGVDYGFGDRNSHIAAWQKQMAKRGAPLEGTGQFGPKTEAVARALQQQNGLAVVGYIGPKTWKLAWTGKFSASKIKLPPVKKVQPKAPAWPGVVYGYGVQNAQVAAWQKQMAKRGAPLEGTGEFGPKTEAVASALQRQNGLAVVGYIGPKTWKLAWTGTYHR